MNIKYILTTYQNGEAVNVSEHKGAAALEILARLMALKISKNKHNKRITFKRLKNDNLRVSVSGSAWGLNDKRDALTCTHMLWVYEFSGALVGSLNF